MAFESVLNAYCTLISCSNKELADLSGISMSAISRYRNGKRTPRAGSDTVDQIAEALSSLARERGITSASSKAVVREALHGSLLNAKLVGPSFSARVDSLMKLLGIRNYDVASMLHMDSSYISRIRRGERTPNDKKRFADAVATIAAERALESGALLDLLTLMGAEDSISSWENLDIDSAMSLSTSVRRWLLGDHVVEADIDQFKELIDKIDKGYFEEVLAEENQAPSLSCPVAEEPSCEFIQGEGFIARSEMLFLETAARCGAKHLYLSSDMPGLETEITADYRESYRRAVLDLVRRGCKITVIHSADRPLRDSLIAMDAWFPLYMTGAIEPLYMQGASNRLFCHINNVCECCALVGEAVRGCESEGRYYVTSMPDDLKYYQKKMELILQKTSRLLEIYRNDDPEGMARFEEDEARRKSSGRGREVCAGRYQNVRIVLYPSDCAVVYLDHPQQYRFVLHHPKLRFIISHMN